MKFPIFGSFLVAIFYIQLAWAQKGFEEGQIQLLPTEWPLLSSSTTFLAQDDEGDKLRKDTAWGVGDDNNEMPLIMATELSFFRELIHDRESYNSIENIGSPSGNWRLGFFGVNLVDNIYGEFNVNFEMFAEGFSGALMLIVGLCLHSTSTISYV